MSFTKILSTTVSEDQRAAARRESDITLDDLRALQHRVPPDKIPEARAFGSDLMNGRYLKELSALSTAGKKTFLARDLQGWSGKDKFLDELVYLGVLSKTVQKTKDGKYTYELFTMLKIAHQWFHYALAAQNV